MIPNKEFETFVKSWFSKNNQDFADDVLNNQDIHSEWLIALWNVFIYSKHVNLI